MSVVERVSETFTKQDKTPKPQSGFDPASECETFDINFKKLANEGFYNTGALTGQLAGEMRAIKRRLMRRIGFLRSTPDRQALRSPGRQRNLVLVTSARAGEGKTFCAMNLALSLAIEDQIETLLIDADVTRPKVCARIGLAPGAGLTDKLFDPSLDLKAICRRSEQAPLTVLGEGSPVGRVTELFASDASQRFWPEITRHWRKGLVVVDAPPVLATTETVILAKYADEIVFVVEANATPEPAVASAIDELLDVNPNVSLVLNRCVVAAGGSHYESYEYYNRNDADAASAQGRK